MAESNEPTHMLGVDYDDSLDPSHQKGHKGGGVPVDAEASWIGRPQYTVGPADDMSMRTPLSDQRKILPSARGNDFARALNSSQEARDLLPLHLGDLERDKNNLYAKSWN